MSSPWLNWKRISEHPKMSEDETIHGPPRVFVYGKQMGHYEFGRVYHYPDSHIRAQAEGFHGDWGITHYAELPEGPTDV